MPAFEQSTVILGLEKALNEEGKFTSMREDVKWVYRMFRKCVRHEGARTIIDMERATEPPPSEGALGLLEWASSNRNEFFGKVVHQYLKEDELDREGEAEKQERKNLVELRRLLEQFRREFERECPAR